MSDETEFIPISEDELRDAIRQAREGTSDPKRYGPMLESPDYNEPYIVWLWQAIVALADRSDVRDSESPRPH